MPVPRTPLLTVLAGLVLTATLVTVGPDAAEPTGTGTPPLRVAPWLGCADLVPPLPGTGRIRPDADGVRLADPDVAVTLSDDGTLGWRSAQPVRAALVAGRERAHLYWYEPTATEDSGLSGPDGPDAPAALELCLDGEAEPDLVAVCIRAGHLPVAGPSVYADGAFDGRLGTRITATVDPDDGALSWRSDGPEVTAVVTAASSPVLVEYDPPARRGEDVPFLGRSATTGRVLFCGVTTIAWDGAEDPTGRGRTSPAAPSALDGAAPQLAAIGEDAGPQRPDGTAPAP